MDWSVPGPLMAGSAIFDINLTDEEGMVQFPTRQLTRLSLQPGNFGFADHHFPKYPSVGRSGLSV
jgi:hypothetical protein